MPEIQKSIVKSRGMRVPAAATYCNLSVVTLNKHRCYGTGPVFHKSGPKIVIYFQEDLDAWLAAGRRRSTSETQPAA
jgi:hypothetical protein